MLDDLRSAFRQLKSAPGHVAVVVVTLGLGIGATTAMYSLVYAVLLRPLDYPQADRIVTLWSATPRGQRQRVSGPDYRDWAAQSRSFSPLAKYRFGGTEGVLVAGAAENIQVAAASGELFALFGVRPVAGRSFTEDETRNGGAVLVGETLVRRYFGGAAEKALGARLKVLGHLFTIVGVLPRSFAFPERTEVWFPVDTAIPEPRDRGKQSYSVVARLATGVSLKTAQAEMAGIAGRLATQYPGTNRDKGVRVVELQEVLVGQYTSTLWLLLAAVALVLLIACANIANLLLARNVRRAHELALRAALGASLPRIARQLFAESLLVALMGGALGAAIAHLSLDALVAIAPARIPGLDRVAVDGGVLAFAAAVSLAVSLLITLFPILHASRLDINTTLRSRSVTVPRGRARAALVIGQLAVSLVLLTCAALLFESLDRLAEVDPGFRPQNLLVLEANYPGGSREDGRKALAFFAELARRAEAMPGAKATTYAQTLPIDWVAGEGRYVTETGEQPTAALHRAIGTRYFSTLGIPLRLGRELEDRDTAGAPATAVVNETLARIAWPGRSPLGQRIRIEGDTSQWMTVVGVAADTKTSLDQPVREELFRPVAQQPMAALSLQVVVRTAVEPLLLAEALRVLSRALDPEVPIKISTAEQKIGRALVAPRFRTVLMGLFAGLAVLLALVGVAGVMAWVVAEGKRAFGIRLALGAQPGRIVREVLLRAARLAGAGLLLGTVGALAATRLLRGMLFGVRAFDAPTFLLSAALLMACALAAAAWPAWRAARTSPMEILRAE